MSEAPGQVGVLLIRAWIEPGVAGWRARILSTRDIDAGMSSTSIVNSVDDVCLTVREWLDEFIEDARR